MKNLLLPFLVFTLFVLSSCGTTYYIVRHGEKAVADNSGSMMGNDPPLSDQGKERARALKEALKNKKIGYIFSTNTVRTKTTAEPTREYFDLETEIYSPIPTESFISSLKSLKKNVLIVGHSNTIDDVVNKLSGAVHVPADLDESIYDNLYVIRKKGKKMIFKNKKYGLASP